MEDEREGNHRKITEQIQEGIYPGASLALPKWSVE